MKHTCLFLSLLFLFSCQRRYNQSPDARSVDALSDTAAIINDPKNFLNIQTSYFIEIDDSGMLVFPLEMGETKRENVSLSYKDTRTGGYWNMIFYNSKAGDYHLLTERKILIERVINDEELMKASHYLFFTVRAEDVNSDKLIDSKDPLYLFISDKSGNNFRQISPSGMNLGNWEYVKSSNKVIMNMTKDSDGNQKFDPSDEVTTFEIVLGADALPTEVFSTAFKNKLKVLFGRDWKRLKE